MNYPTMIIQNNNNSSEQQEPSFLVEQVALCIPCGSGMSLSGNSDTSSLASWELDGDIDTSFSSRSSVSPMAKALDRLSEPTQTQVLPASTKKKKGRKNRKQRPQLTAEEMAKLPCRFFLSKAGCRAGASCPYNHCHV